MPADVIAWRGACYAAAAARARARARNSSATRRPRSSVQMIYAVLFCARALRVAHASASSASSGIITHARSHRSVQGARTHARTLPIQITTTPADDDKTPRLTSQWWQWSGVDVPHPARRRPLCDRLDAMAHRTEPLAVALSRPYWGWGDARANNNAK